jgi:hypothetical protein
VQQHKLERLLHGNEIGRHLQHRWWSTDSVGCQDRSRSGRALHLLGLGHGPVLVPFCFAGLAPVRDDLLVVWGAKRIAAGECHNRRSKQVNQSAPPRQSSDERVAASENSAASL